MLSELEALDYKKVFYWFSELAKIPHGSGNVTQIADYLEQFAKDREISYVRDCADNVIFYKPATEGFEDRPVIILQGHMDMVCEKDADFEHDFQKDGLKLQFDGEWLSAEGTTLGGDDGIAVAYCLAILSDETLAHPALECVITTEEETGMDGAKALDPKILSGRYLLNLDSEDETTVLCGCAGGMRITGHLPLRWQATTGRLLRVEIKNLLGGHSGTEIHKNRTNAVHLMTRFLFELKEQCEVLLTDFAGGNKDNAIPRECCAFLTVEENPEEFIEAAKAVADVLKEELSAAEPQLEFVIAYEGDSAEEQPVLHPLALEKLLFLLMQAPNGVQTKSAEIEGLVESSLNLGIFLLKPEEAEIHWSLRSSKKSYLQFMKEKILYLVEFLGGEAVSGSEYPAWEYVAESKLREAYQKFYEQEFGSLPEMTVIHAGLECGILSEKLPGLDAISVGPQMHDIHTPSERLSVSSSIRLYRLLERFLEKGGID